MGVLFGLGQSLCWALTTALLRSLSDRLDAFLLNGLRAAMALCIIMPLVALRGAWDQYQLVTASRFALLSGSVLVGGVIGDVCYLKSLKTLGVGRAFPVTNTYPLLTVLLSAALLGTAITLRVVAGGLLVIAGVYAIARPRPSRTVDGLHRLPRAALARGLLMALATALCWSFATIILAEALEGIDGVVATSVRVPVVAAVSLTAAARRGQLAQLCNLGRKAWVQLVLTGILGWGLGGTLYALAVQTAGPGRTAILSATSPLFGLLFASLFLGERPHVLAIVGTLLTVVGVVLVA